MNKYVLPSHANALGNVFGGQVMAWVDVGGAIAAQRHSGRNPVKIGEVIHLEAQVPATFKTSLEVHIRVEGENPRTGERWPCVDAMLTFVAIDDHGRPLPVPPHYLTDEIAQKNQRPGEERREKRLEKSHAARPQTDR
ncbi:hypothetical protein OUZ56_032547 [Daphnia magna]|uniref:HotDog ACOT-type domain-containing protein n=1 Tax=Daphnia magna TaxID=35525 RepID=A0ABR0B978_9CRUS|nr:hypothetical protein OUZ56_032547 [Daphnia magna]